MIIAHGPFGYLAAYVTRRWWLTPASTAQQRRRLYAVAFIGGMFPDIDLFFYYFVNATLSHRQFITHSLIPYSIIVLLGVILQRRGVSLFALGALTHLVGDTLVGTAAIFLPFSNHLYGLLNIPWYQHSIFVRYSLVTNFTAEFALIISALAIAVKQRWIIITATGLAIIGIGTMVYVNQHIYRPNGLFYYADDDGDGTLNIQDRDLDGDGTLNIDDIDIDNDGEDNSVDFNRETYDLVGTLYDYSEGVAVELPLRLGLVTNPKLVERAYANVGISFITELQADYAINPLGYQHQPRDDNFVTNPANWQVWLQHQHKLLPADTAKHWFDIIFFSSGQVGIFTRPDDVDSVLIAHRASPLVQHEPLFGEIVAIGRILPKPIDKQY
ncbi:MAG: metal-dependent hydrolase [Candidatus Kerfeldbacteria bacterium]|nr:metal-dependent hydrolase [Candidatus Kerfeldbacteria bacterium]